MLSISSIRTSLASLRGWIVYALDQTWELKLNAERTVVGATLLPRTFHLLNLPNNTAKARVRFLFGAPSKNGAEDQKHDPRSDIRIGGITTWDEYDRGGIRYRFEYRGPLAKLASITVQIYTPLPTATRSTDEKLA